MCVGYKGYKWRCKQTDVGMRNSVHMITGTNVGTKVEYERSCE